MEDTTTIAAESFLTEQTEVEAILSAAGVLSVELKLVNGTVTATGKVSKLDPYLKRRIAKAKAEIKTSLSTINHRVLSPSRPQLQNRTGAPQSWF